MNTSDTNNLPTDSQPSAEAAPPPPDMGTFADLGLSAPVLQAVTEMGFTAPMPVQKASIPHILAGKDMMVQSRTGSGKTAAFGIPIVDRVVDSEAKHVQAIILLPTRELALQVAAELAKVSAHKTTTVAPIYGGAPMGRQIEQLKAGAQVVAGTPGRILDHIRRGTLDLSKVRCAVLDECDEMLSMGFQEDIEAILEHTPESRQTLLYSATLPEGIQRLSRRFLRDPERLKLSADFVGVASIKHLYYSVSGGNRDADLASVLAFENPERAIIFCNTREETGRVASFLKGRGMQAEAISSDLSQSDREKVMGLMRAGSLQYLVATDVAARGIDLDRISHVVNYTFPDSAEVYIHRTGRTGRAGKHGIAVSLIGPSEIGAFYYLKLLYKIKPEERSLPSPVEIQSRREGEQIVELRRRFAAEPGPSWRSLARRVLSALDGERMVAALLAETLSGAKATRSQSESRASSSDAAPAREHRPSSERGDRGDRGRERPGYGRDREERPRSDRPERADRPERSERPERSLSPERSDRPERTERPSRDRADRAERPERTERPSRDRADRPERSGWRERESSRTGEPGEGRRSSASPSSGQEASRPESYDNVWSDGNAAPAREPRRESPRHEAPRPAEPRRSEAAEGQARLYLNLGRKDRATPDEVAQLAASVGITLALHDIDVMNTHTYLNVDNADSDRLVEAMNGRERQGRTLICERARPRGR